MSVEGGEALLSIVVRPLSSPQLLQNQPNWTYGVYVIIHWSCINYLCITVSTKPKFDRMNGGFFRQEFNQTTRNVCLKKTRPISFIWKKVYKNLQKAHRNSLKISLYRFHWALWFFCWYFIWENIYKIELRHVTLLRLSSSSGEVVMTLAYQAGNSSFITSPSAKVNPA